MNFDISFRPFALQDAAFVNALRRNEEREKQIVGAKRPVSYERDQKWIEDIILKDNQTAVYYAITLAGQDDIIGYTSIGDIDYRNGGCFWNGIKIDKAHAGKGFGLQVALKVLKYVFEELRMERCQGTCLESHGAVVNILNKAGFRHEGVMRHKVFKDGKYHNELLVSVIREEYDSIKQTFNL